MARPLVGSGALITSVIAHALLLGAGALLLSRSLGERDKAALVRPTTAREVEVELPTFDSAASDQARESEPNPLDSALAAVGGGPLERHPDTELAGRGGSKTAAEAATNLDSHIDPITL